MWYLINCKNNIDYRIYKKGFYLKELYHEIDWYILGQCTLKGSYEN